MFSLGDNAVRTGNIEYFLSKKEIKDHNVMIDEHNASDQPVKNDLRTCESIRKTATGQAMTTQLVDCLILLTLKKTTS